MDIQKKHILIGSAILLVLVLVGTVIFFATRLSPKSLASLQTGNQFLLQPTQQPPEQLSLPTQTPTPTLAPTKISPTVGSIWAIYSIEYLAFQQDGFSYDVGTFTNIKTGEVIRAHCMNPNWPSPRLGTLYKINEAMVLIPIKENPRHPLQRFFLISN